jgi:hypothetical protein
METETSGTFRAAKRPDIHSWRHDVGKSEQHLWGQHGQGSSLIVKLPVSPIS